MKNEPPRYLPHPEARALVEGDIDPVIPPAAREVMLDLVLAWANLDGSVAFLAAATGGLNPSQGAERFGRKVIADKLIAAAKSLKASGHDADAARVQRISDEYPDKAKLRRRVAHSRCAGVRRSDPSRVVFLPYETEGPDGHLAMEIYGLDAFAADTAWARRVHGVFLDAVDRLGFFDMEPPA